MSNLYEQGMEAAKKRLTEIHAAEVARLQERVRVLECLRDAVQVWMDGTPDGQADHCNAIFEAMDALAQPQPCQTCGGKGYETHALGWMPCPDCKPQQKEGK